MQGVFVDDGSSGLRFVPNPEPGELEVEELLLSVARRITRLAKRHGIELDRPQEEEAIDALAGESPLLAGISGASILGAGRDGRSCRPIRPAPWPQCGLAAPRRERPLLSEGSGPIPARAGSFGK